MKKTPAGGSPQQPVARTDRQARNPADYLDKELPGSLWNRFPWNWLVSLRVGIVLLAILTVASIAGTLITPLEKAQAAIYYAWWYKILLVGLAANMGCATLRTIGRKILSPLPTWIRRNPQFFETQEPRTTRDYRGTGETVADAFRRRGYAVATEGEYAYAIKGRLSRWGAPVSHTGLVLVLLCGFASSWFSREGMLQVVEGQQTDMMQVRGAGEEGKEVPLGFTVHVEDFDTAFFPRTRIASHFVSTITVEKEGKVLFHGPVEVNSSPRAAGWTFHQTSYQEVPRMPRFRMRITSAELSKPVEIDLSPGQERPIPTLPDVKVGMNTGSSLRWEIARAGQTLGTGILGNGTRTKGTLRLLADRFEPDFVMGRGRTISSRSGNLNNPALHVQVLDGDQEVASQWLFGREDMKAMMHGSAGPVHLALTTVEGQDGDYRFHVAVDDAENGTPLVADVVLLLNQPAAVGSAAANKEESPSPPSSGAAWKVELVKKGPAYATVLTLTRNPLIPVIYSACTLMMLGMLGGFFLIRKEVWLRVNPRDGRLQVAAAYRYGRMAFDHELRGLLEEIAPERKPPPEPS